MPFESCNISASGLILTRECPAHLQPPPFTVIMGFLQSYSWQTFLMLYIVIISHRRYYPAKERTWGKNSKIRCKSSIPTWELSRCKCALNWPATSWWGQLQQNILILFNSTWNRFYSPILHGGKLKFFSAFNLTVFLLKSILVLLWFGVSGGKKKKKNTLPLSSKSVKKFRRKKLKGWLAPLLFKTNAKDWALLPSLPQHSLCHARKRTGHCIQYIHFLRKGSRFCP